VLGGGEHEASLVKSYLFPNPKLVVLKWALELTV